MERRERPGSPVETPCAWPDALIGRREASARFSTSIDFAPLPAVIPPVLRFPFVVPPSFHPSLRPSSLLQKPHTLTRANTPFLSIPRSSRTPSFPFPCSRRSNCLVCVHAHRRRSPLSADAPRPPGADERAGTKKQRGSSARGGAQKGTQRKVTRFTGNARNWRPRKVVREARMMERGGIGGTRGVTAVKRGGGRLHARRVSYNWFSRQFDLFDRATGSRVFRARGA